MVNVNFKMRIMYDVENKTLNATNAALGKTSSGFRSLGIDMIDAKAKTSKFNSGFVDVNTMLGDKIPKSSKKSQAATQSLMGSFTKFRVALVSMYLIPMMLMKVVSPIIKFGAEIEILYTRISAVTGESFDVVQSRIKALAAGSVYSLTEIGNAYLELAKQGFNAVDSMKIMESTTALAMAGFLDLQGATEIVAQTIHQFNLEASDAARISDVMAKAANLSAADVEGLGKAMSFAGTIANSLGYSIEEVAATLSVLTNKGLAAGKAGIYFRAAMTSILKPSDQAQDAMDSLGWSFKDASGEFKSMGDIVEMISYTFDDSVEKADYLAQIFDRRALQAVLALTDAFEDGAMGIEEYNLALEQSGGYAEQLANKISQTTEMTTKKVVQVTQTMIDESSRGLGHWWATLKLNALKFVDDYDGAVKEAVQTGKVAISEFEKLGGVAVKKTVRPKMVGTELYGDEVETTFAYIGNMTEKQKEGVLFLAKQSDLMVAQVESAKELGYISEETADKLMGLATHLTQDNLVDSSTEVGTIINDNIVLLERMKTISSEIGNDADDLIKYYKQQGDSLKVTLLEAMKLKEAEPEKFAGVPITDMIGVLGRKLDISYLGEQIKDISSKSREWGGETNKIVTSSNAILKIHAVMNSDMKDLTRSEREKSVEMDKNKERSLEQLNIMEELINLNARGNEQARLEEQLTTTQLADLEKVRKGELSIAQLKKEVIAYWDELNPRVKLHNDGLEKTNKELEKAEKFMKKLNDQWELAVGGIDDYDRKLISITQKYRDMVMEAEDLGVETDKIFDIAAMEIWTAQLGEAEESLSNLADLKYPGFNEMAGNLLEMELALLKQEKGLLDLEKQAEDTDDTLGGMTDSYKAWVEGIRIAVSALVDEARDSNKDISRLTREFMDQAQGINEFKRESSEETMTEEEKDFEKKKKLYELERREHELTQDIFGMEIKKVIGFNEEEAQSLDAVTNAIGREKSKISDLKSNINDLEKSIESLIGWNSDEVLSHEELTAAIIAETKALRALRKEQERADKKRAKAREDRIAADTTEAELAAGWTSAFESQRPTTPDAYDTLGQGVSTQYPDSYTKSVGQTEAQQNVEDLLEKWGFTGFANGGIVRSPTLAMIGERGPEAIIPLTGSNAVGGISFGNINIYGTDMSAGEVEMRFAQVIKRELASLGR